MIICLAAGLVWAGPAPASTAQQKIQHVIIIMQENRSFDHYFGTFPGANGIPSPPPCMPVSISNPAAGCTAPFHDIHGFNAGTNHFAAQALAQMDDGVLTAKMDGFLQVQVQGGVAHSGTSCQGALKISPDCYPIADGIARHDVMGYHTAEEIPNYWAYAAHFRLMDGMFPGIRGWSATTHLDMTSEWAAICKSAAQSTSCKTSSDTLPPNAATQYPWASLFQFFDTNNISWKYYLGTGTEPDCDADEGTCAPQNQGPTIPGYWNPAPYFQYVKQKGAPYLASHVVDFNTYLVDIKNGTLPQVSWIVPSTEFSEHAPADVTLGMDYVTSIVNAVMQSAYWSNTVIAIVWDDWGGFYDHVVPPITYRLGARLAYGLGQRVPAILIGAYVIPGVDHNFYSFDSYTRMIEDIFTTGPQRLDPAGLGLPDSRPYIADSLMTARSITGATINFGEMVDQFDFNQTPLPPLVLSIAIPGGLKTLCTTQYAPVCTTRSVYISWNAIGGAAALNPVYHVTRDGVEIGKKCITTTTRCLDRPGSGDHIYRVYAVINGVASPPSAANEIVEP